MDKIKEKRTVAMLLNKKSKVEKLGLKEETENVELLLKEYQEQKEQFDASKLEWINRPEYKANALVVVDEYISENPKEFIKAIKMALEGKRVLIIGDTGIGKGYSLYKVLEKLVEIKALVGLPSVSIVTQQSEDYKIPASFGKIKDDETKSLSYCMSKSDKVIATWNKIVIANKDEDIVKLFKEVVLILDEVHEIYDSEYKKEVVRELKYMAESGIFRGCVEMTATPDRLFLEDYDYIVEYRKKEKAVQNVKLYDCINDDVIINAINSSVGKFSVYREHINSLNYYSVNANGKTEVVHTKNKDTSALYKSIIKKATFGAYKGLLHTGFIIAGLNNKDEDFTDIFIINCKDAVRIKQVCERYRKAKNVTIHIFNNYADKDADFVYLKSCIDYQIKEETARVDRLNANINEGFEIVYFATDYQINKDSTIYFDKNTLRYNIDVPGIVAGIHNSYNKSRSRKQFRVLLNRYFNNIEFVDTIKTDEDKKALKEAKKKKKNYIESMDKDTEKIFAKFEDCKEALILYNPISRGAELTPDQQLYVKNKGINIEHKKIIFKDMKVDETVKDNSLFEAHNDLFNHYVIDKHFEVNLAFNLAKLNQKQYSKVYNSIEVLKYEYEMQNNTEVMSKAKNTLVSYNRIDYIINLNLENTAFRTEHYEKLLCEYSKSNKKDTVVKRKDLTVILDGAYNNVRTDATVDSNFYEGLIPQADKFNKRGKTSVTLYKEKTTLEDVAKILKVESDNKTLIELVQGKKTL